MTRSHSKGVLGGQIDEAFVVAGPAYEARAGCLAERHTEPQLGLTPTSASWTSSIVLMKWAWPMMTFMSSGLSIRTTSSSTFSSFGFSPCRSRRHPERAKLGRKDGGDIGVLLRYQQADLAENLGHDRRRQARRARLLWRSPRR